MVAKSTCVLYLTATRGMLRTLSGWAPATACCLRLRARRPSRHCPSTETRVWCSADALFGRRDPPRRCALHQDEQLRHRAECVGRLLYPVASCTWICFLRPPLVLVPATLQPSYCWLGQACLRAFRGPGTPVVLMADHGAGFYNGATGYSTQEYKAALDNEQQTHGHCLTFSCARQWWHGNIRVWSVGHCPGTHGRPTTG